MIDKKKNHLLLSYQTISIGIGLGIFYWILESALEAFVFSHGGDFFYYMFPPEFHVIWHRLLVLTLIIISVVLAKAFIISRKRTKEALRDSEKKYGDLFQSTLDGVYQTDANGIFSSINPAGAKMLGYNSPEEVVGKSAINHWADPKDRDIFIQELKRKKFVKAYPILTKRQDGSKFYFEATSKILEDEKGNFVGIEGILRDITERKRVQDELLILQKINNMLIVRVGQEAIFKTIVDGIRSLYNYDSVAIHLLSKDQKYIIVKSYSADSNVAKKLEKLTGFTIIGFKAPLYEGSLFNDIVETKKPVITSDISQVLKGYTDKKSLQGLAVAVSRLTKAKWGIGVPLLAEDKVIGTIGCGSIEKPTEEDIKRLARFGSQAGIAFEKAQTYEKLEYTNVELIQSNRLKDLFIDIMRHDLLNPTTVVKGMAQLALKAEEDPERKETFQAILKTTELIIDMIENASILAQLESGEKLELKEDDLGIILKNAVKGNTHMADEKKTQVRLEAKGEFKASVNPLLFDVFSNLINNAIKYGPEDSRVVVKIEKDNLNWRISVADSGEGVPDEYKEAIFDRFKRVKKGGVKGTGLGLAIVKKIVNAHSGRVWVEDNSGGGSVFHVMLPKK